MLDKSSVDNCYKFLDKVVSLCQHPRLNLKNSPPYILDIIPDVYEKLQGIITFYRNNYEALSQIEYFGIFISSLVEKCKETIHLFKDSTDKIFDAHSNARFRLIKLSLVFSHMLKELEALFPENSFALSTFRITKPDAAAWWSSNFGHSAIVPWQMFQNAILRTFHIDSANHILALHRTIDLTRNQHVSIFEFDVFSRLFQPWNNVLETWKALIIQHPGYMAFMTYDEVKAVLKQYRVHPGPGSYVFRLSCTKLGQWAIGYITVDLKILQTIIQNKSLVQALVDGEREGFYLYPNGKPNPPRLLSQLVYKLPRTHLQVTQEQYQAYCKIGSTFELCKICDENNKDIRLEPCSHLICRICLLNCQSSGNGQTCPFCRREIKGIEDIVVDPFKPSAFNNTDSAVFDQQISPPFRQIAQKCDLQHSLNHSFSVENPPNPIDLCDGRSRWSTFDLSCLPSENPLSHFPTRNAKSDLNYAQLDLNNSDSDDEFHVMSEANSLIEHGPNETDSNEILNGTESIDHNSPISSTSCNDLPKQLDDPLKYSGQPNEACLCTYSPSALNETAGDNSPSASNIPDSTQCESLADNIKCLLSVHHDMSEEHANLLLSITNNQVEMSNKIWEHFVPRTSS